MHTQVIVKKKVEISCESCDRMKHVCSFRYDSATAIDWGAIAAASSLSHPDGNASLSRPFGIVYSSLPLVVARRLENLSSLVYSYNSFSAQAEMLVFNANQLLPLIADLQDQLRDAAMDPTTILPYLRHQGAPLSPEQAVLVAAILNWETEPSLRGTFLSSGENDFSLHDSQGEVAISSSIVSHRFYSASLSF